MWKWEHSPALLFLTLWYWVHMMGGPEAVNFMHRNEDERLNECQTFLRREIQLQISTSDIVLFSIALDINMTQIGIIEWVISCRTQP